MNENFEKNSPDFNSEEVLKEKDASGADGLIDFVESGYFINFLDKLDDIKDESVFLKMKEELGVDVSKIKEYIDIKIPVLIEKIKEADKRQEIEVVIGNSFRDVLGNSITAIFRTILKTASNFDKPEMQEKIKNPESSTRKILALFSQEDAEYYINALCEDAEKLKKEAGSIEGFLGEFKEYFKVFPSGSAKAIYFRFFGELEKGNMDIKTLTKELEKINDFESKTTQEILDKEKVVSDFAKGEFKNRDF